MNDNTLERTLERMQFARTILGTERNFGAITNYDPMRLAGGLALAGTGAIALASILPHAAPALAPIMVSAVTGAGIGTLAGALIGPGGLVILGKGFLIPTAQVLGLTGAYAGASVNTWLQMATGGTLIVAKIMTGVGLALIAVAGVLLVVRLISR